MTSTKPELRSIWGKATNTPSNPDPLLAQRVQFECHWALGLKNPCMVWFLGPNSLPALELVVRGTGEDDSTWSFAAAVVPRDDCSYNPAAA